jgi:SWI/SNF-related matrix-associated actin-dependent regulator 1 of chromatin subfamily A
MMPNLFEECREDLAGVFKHRIKTNVRGDTEDGNGANLLLSEQRIQKAKTMMTPFVLRRKKDQVLKHLPEKRQRIEYCDMVPAQQAIYNEQMKSSRDLLEARANGEKTKNLGNILMQLRKAAIHPLLFRRIFSDKVLKGMAKEIMKEDRYKEANETYIFEDMEVMTDAELHYLCEQFPGSIGKHLLKEDEWNNSGKIKKLLKLLPEMKARGDRILLFSQFTQVLDILERVLNHINVTFIRLDGGTPVEIRQDMIDKFHNESDITVFLLSTRAGGFGINLACANVVILFDLSFNPHDDRQAEDRAHRVGQTREVDVIRLITKDSIEESIYAVQKTKLALDKHVSSDENAQEADKTERHNASLVASMIFNTKVEDSEA